MGKGEGSHVVLPDGAVQIGRVRNINIDGIGDFLHKVHEREKITTCGAACYVFGFHR